jgi:uncharacterized membrane protein YciS (DUF1049 family)
MFGPAMRSARGETPVKRQTARAALVGGALLALAALGLHAQDIVARASVDRAQIYENESFNYMIRVEGGAVGEPDVSFLEQQFDVLNRSAASRINLLNGRTQQIYEWTYQLMPKRAGQFTLPALQFGAVLSNPVTLDVLPAPVAPDEVADIFMEVAVEPARVYVQAEVIYTLRLFVGVGTSRASLTAPPVVGSEAIVERLGEDQRYQVVRGGRNFVVNERRYAIFPQQAGALTLGPATYEAMVVPNRGFSRVQRLRSETVELEVLPAVPPPPELAGAAWLPARSLTLTETWADGNQAFSVGVPRTRILTIAAEGLLETQLPELELEQAPGIRQYPDQPELASERTPGGLKVTRTERYAVIAQAAGEASIPAAEMPWWNVRDERWEVARLAPTVVAVAAGAQAAAVPTTAAELPPAGEFVTSTSYWPLVSAILSLAWLTTILLWVRARFGSGKRKREADALRARSSSFSSRRLSKQLEAACRADDAARARDLLLEWAGQAFAPDPPASLGALRERLPEPLAAEVGALEAELYGRQGPPWSGRGLAELAASLDSVKSAPAKGDSDPLVPLYR